MDGIDLSGLKASAAARVEEEARRAELRGANASPGGFMTQGGAPETTAGRGLSGAAVDSAGGRPAVGTSSPTVIEVTEANFEREVIERSRYVPVIVDLWAEWCQPCTQLGPLLQKLAEEYDGAWVLGTINTEAEQGLAAAFRVQSIPMVVALVQGRPVDMFTGMQPEPKIRAWLDALIKGVQQELEPLPDTERAAGEADPPATPALVEQAEVLADQGDYEQAQQLLNAYLVENPGDREALAALSLYSTLGRAALVADDVIDQANQQRDDVALQCAAADKEMTEMGAEFAFTRLLETVARTSGDDRDEARQHLLGLLAMCDPIDPLVLAARGKLASLLY